MEINDKTAELLIKKIRIARELQEKYWDALRGIERTLEVLSKQPCSVEIDSDDPLPCIGTVEEAHAFAHQNVTVYYEDQDAD